MQRTISEKLRRNTLLFRRVATLTHMHLLFAIKKRYWAKLRLHVTDFPHQTEKKSDLNNFL